MPDNRSGGERRRGSLLGVVAYLLVPGERRKAAAEHFRRAGVEAARGLGELAKSGRDESFREEDGEKRGGRERIELD